MLIKYQWWFLYIQQAYIHVVNRFVGYVNDPSKLEIDDKKERADYVARVEEGLHYLNILYTMSIEEKITLLRQTCNP